MASIINNAADGVTVLTDATLSLYDASGTLITDPTLVANCVKSTLDIEPPYDYYIAGGNVKSDVQAANIYLNLIGVPDVPAAYGGSKAFVQNVNLKYINPAIGVEADGRAAKWLQYSATYHTNKLRFQFTHPAGYQLGIAIFLELYKL